MGSYRSGATMTNIQMTEWEWPSEPRFLMCTPLSHAGAAFFVPVLLLGGSLVVVPYFEPGLVLKTIEEERITATMLVPTMLYMLMDHPDFATRDLSSLETVYYGAAAMSPTRLKEAIDRLGPIFFQYYGQAEGPMTICVLRKDEHDTTTWTAWPRAADPCPWVHVKLLDDDLNEVPRGEPGEICVRGPLVMQGYWNKPEQTAEALAGGWLHTGDIAREDEDGFYTIVDRKKDMIVTGGFNVFPREVEDVISSHPAVANVAVIGVPDDRWGEAVKAVVVLRPDASVDGLGRRRRADRAGEGGQGLDPGAEVGRLRRRDPAQPARQARQEGPPPAVLDGHRPSGQLTGVRGRRQPETTPPSMIVVTTWRDDGSSSTCDSGPSSTTRSAGAPTATRRGAAAGGLGRRQEQGQRPLGRHRLAQPERLAPGGAALDGRGHVAPRVGVAVRARRCCRPPGCPPRSGCGTGTGAAGRRRRPRPGSGRRVRGRIPGWSPPSRPRDATIDRRSGGTTDPCSMRSPGRLPTSSQAARARASPARVTQWTATGRSASWAARIHRIRSSSDGSA